MVPCDFERRRSKWGEVVFSVCPGLPFPRFRGARGREAPACDQSKSPEEPHHPVSSIYHRRALPHCLRRPTQHPST
eukprot:4538276-Prymnesium_polylepis.1